MEGNKTFGSILKSLREEKNMTQEELGKCINSTKQTIFKYENNIVKNIPMDKIQMLSTVLGCTPAYLMGWETEISSPLPIKTNTVISIGRGGERREYEISNEDAAFVDKFLGMVAKKK